jgi:heterodisulfide reductase subunit B
MRYSLYPGCSLKGTGRAYEESVLTVFKALGVELQELKDWNCCGATAYMSVDENKAFALAVRNLALAEQEGESALVTPSSACYLSLNKAHRHMEEDSEIRAQSDSSLKAAGLSYRGTVKVRHPLDVLVNDVGLETITKKVKVPLHNLRVAPYYGCQIVRPFAEFDSQYNPVTMDQLLEAIGAEVVRYPLKTRCCSGSQTGSLPDVGLRLVYILLREACRRDAEVLVTVCPLCQFNLEGYQDEIGRKYEDSSIPVLYFTQALGLAMGLPAKQLGLKRNLVPVDQVLEKWEVNCV